MVNLRDFGTAEVNNWCPGCGNFGILTAFKSALVELSLKREQVVLVSGIGCHGKMINWVNVNGFHGIHGRPIPIATGIKLANPDLQVVVFSGDADCYDEGWDHFCHAVRRNIDITVIVHDNMILGLTTGQATATSQIGFKSKSTPYGSVVPPLNPLAHAVVAGGSFVARGFAGDPKHLAHLIVAAMQHRGFSYIDVFQPCVTFNYMNTYEWFRQRVYKLEETGHDVSDQQKALEKCFEWDGRLPIGTFYMKDWPAFRDNLPHVRNKNLARASLENIDISSLMKNMK